MRIRHEKIFKDSIVTQHRQENFERHLIYILSVRYGTDLSMDGPPSSILLLEKSLSRLKLHFTNTTITIAMIAEHRYGRLYPTTNRTLSGNSMTKPVVATGTIRNPTPQHLLNIATILRNMLLVSYLRAICALKAFSRLISLAMKSSTKL
jgi:hypothetical protein